MEAQNRPRRQPQAEGDDRRLARPAERRSMRVLTQADYREMRWRNGGGRTREIVRIAAPGGGDEDFLWRVSIASVEASGAFSSFAGYERSLSVISGAGIRLIADDFRIEIARPFEPARFSGAAAVHGELIDGPIEDFNLIHARGRVEGAVRFIEARELAGEMKLKGDDRLLYVLSGALEVAGGDGAPALRLGPQHALLDEGRRVGSLRVSSVSADARIALVEVERLG